jgi:hypothetical protein
MQAKSFRLETVLAITRDEQCTSLARIDQTSVI